MSNTTPEINVGALSEALNDKADLDMNNISSATLSAKIAPLLESLGGVVALQNKANTTQVATAFGKMVY